MSDLASLIQGLWGNAPAPKPMQYTPLAPEAWPSPADAREARDYKSRFGNVNERDISTGMPQRQIPLAEAPERFQQSTLYDAKASPLGSPEADALYAAQIAANRNPLAALGFDNTRSVISPADPKNALTAAGLYSPTKDAMWADLGSPSSIVHESVHRGINMLAQQGDTLAKSLLDDNELITRALMFRRHGGVEEDEDRAGGATDDSAGIAEAKAARELAKRPEFSKILDALEKSAGNAIAARNLARGPL